MRHTLVLSRRQRPSRQRGVVLLFSLIALAIMLIAAVALMRSTQSSLYASGNLGFKRDLQNQSERAVAKVLPLFRTGGTLSAATSRASSQTANNYSAVMLTADNQGVPTALLTDAAFNVVGNASNDITPTTDTSLPPNQIQRIRYLVDRLCSATGNEATLGVAQCVLGDNPTPKGCSADNCKGAERTGVSGTNAAAALQSIVYRISIQVTGPRNTQSYFQTTFAVPSS